MPLFNWYTKFAYSIRLGLCVIVQHVNHIDKNWNGDGEGRISVPTVDLSLKYIRDVLGYVVTVDACAHHDFCIHIFHRDAPHQELNRVDGVLDENSFDDFEEAKSKALDVVLYLAENKITRRYEEEV